MSETLQIALITGLINGSITWGIMSTKLAWLRHDVERIDERISACEARHNNSNSQNKRNHD